MNLYVCIFLRRLFYQAYFKSTLSDLSFNWLAGIAKKYIGVPNILSICDLLTRNRILTLIVWSFHFFLTTSKLIK